MNKAFQYVSLSAAAWLLTASAVFAGSLGFTPDQGSYQVGDRIEVDVVMSSPRQAVNAVNTVVAYDPDKLLVADVQKHRANVSFWIEDGDTYDNGVISLEGLLINKGFRGRGEVLATITFVARSSGVADVLIAQGALHAYDGQGTNVLEDTENARFVIAPDPDGLVLDTIPGEILADLQSPSRFDQTQGALHHDLAHIPVIGTLYDPHRWWFAPMVAATTLFVTIGGSVAGLWLTGVAAGSATGAGAASSGAAAASGSGAGRPSRKD